jgi:hypothetical protein
VVSQLVDKFAAVQKSDIKVGGEYAIREPAKKGVEFQRVKALEFVRGNKWKVEWLEPNPGLIDYLASKNFIVPWSKRTAFLRDEQRAENLQRANEMAGFPGESHPMSTAVQLVFDAVGDRDIHIYRGVLTSNGDALERLAARAGVPSPQNHAAYKDRLGALHHPWSTALELAQRFAGREPRTVLDDIDATEREWSIKVREQGERYLAPLLNEYRSSFAIVRQWAGHDQAVALREERINELERLLTSVMWDLRRPGAEPERIAARIERALKGQ